MKSLKDKTNLIDQSGLFDEDSDFLEELCCSFSDKIGAIYEAVISFPSYVGERLYNNIIKPLDSKYHKSSGQQIS